MPLTVPLFLIIYCLLNLLLCRHDLREGLLPDRLTCPLLWSGLLFHVCCRPAALSGAVIGAVSGYASLALLYWLYRWLRGREGLGYGDVKLLAALGAWQGWQPLPTLVLIASGLALAVTGGRFIIRGDITAFKNPLPFGPFLAAAGFITGGQVWLSLPP